MDIHLTATQRTRYANEGYLAPIRVLTIDEAASYRKRVEEFISVAKAKGSATALRTKAHLHCPALLELVHLPAILDAIGDVLGPDLLCRSSSIFLKEPGDPSYVAWHQDATYWDLDPPDVATAWVALTESTVENGALKVIPRSHLAPLLDHGTINDPANMLSRGQAITAALNEDEAVALTLAPGEMSIHHVSLAHGSAPNRSSGRRVGVAIRYVAPHVKKNGPRRDSALLVRGADRFGNFDPEAV